MHTHTDTHLPTQPKNTAHTHAHGGRSRGSTPAQHPHITDSLMHIFVINAPARIHTNRVASAFCAKRCVCLLLLSEIPAPMLFEITISDWEFRRCARRDGPPSQRSSSYPVCTQFGVGRICMAAGRVQRPIGVQLRCFVVSAAIWRTARTNGERWRFGTAALMRSLHSRKSSVHIHIHCAPNGER